MARYAIEPQRDLLRHEEGDETQFVPCDEAEAETFAVFDMIAGPGNGDLMDDFPSRAEAEAFIARLNARELAHAADKLRARDDVATVEILPGGLLRTKDDVGDVFEGGPVETVEWLDAGLETPGTEPEPYAYEATLQRYDAGELDDAGVIAELERAGWTERRARVILDQHVEEDEAHFDSDDNCPGCGEPIGMGHADGCEEA